MRKLCKYAILMTGFLVAARAHADEASAREYLGKAAKALDAKDWRDFNTQIKLAKTEVAEVAGEKKNELDKLIADLGGRAMAARGSEGKKDAENSARRAVGQLEAAIGSEGFAAAAADFERYLADPENAAALGEAEVAKLKKKIKTFKVVSDEKVAELRVSLLKPRFDRLEAKLVEVLEKLKVPDQTSRDADYFQADLDTCSKMLKEIPESHLEYPRLAARLKKANDAFAIAAGGQEVDSVVARLRRSWSLYENEYGGWELEQGTPTFAEIISQQSDKLSKLNMPKTVAMVQRATAWLKTAEEDAAIKRTASNPKVAAVVEEIKSARQKGWGKLIAAAEVILAEAEKTALDKNARGRLERFANDDLRLALEDAPESETLKARARKLTATFDGAAGGASEAAESIKRKLTEQAAKAWPDMVSKLPADDKFDAAAAIKGEGKGKLVRLSNVSNRMGWDFKPGEYDFALKSNGAAVVGRYDPGIKKTVASILERSKLTDLPEEKYDVVGEVVGPVKATIFENFEGTGKIQGANIEVKTTGQRETVVDAVLLRIVGLHVGPVAAVVGVGSVDEFGALNPIEGVASTNAGRTSDDSLLGRLCILLFGLMTATAALLKAGFAPLKGTPATAQLEARIGPTGLLAFGVLAAVYGLYSLIVGRVVQGFLVSAGFLAAGSYLMCEPLAGLLPPKANEALRANGVTIGLALAVIVLLHLVLGGALRVI